MTIQSETLEIGQDDFLEVLKDYRIAKLSWQHFTAAYGELGSGPNALRSVVDAARIYEPFDYILTGLLYDVILAISRLTDGGQQRGSPKRVSLLTIQSHLATKRKSLSDASSLSRTDAAISKIKSFRQSPSVHRLRSRRDSHLAHRLQGNHAELSYSDIEDLLPIADQLFKDLAPLFHATADYPAGILEQFEHSTNKFWACLSLGAQQVALAKM